MLDGSWHMPNASAPFAMSCTVRIEGPLSASTNHGTALRSERMWRRVLR